MEIIYIDISYKKILSSISERNISFHIPVIEKMISTILSNEFRFFLQVKIKFLQAKFKFLQVTFKFLQAEFKFLQVKFKFLQVKIKFLQIKAMVSYKISEKIVVAKRSLLQQ